MRVKRQKQKLTITLKYAILVLCCLLCLLISVVDCEPRRSSGRRSKSSGRSSYSYSRSSNAQTNAQSAVSAPKTNAAAPSAPKPPSPPASNAQPGNIGWNVNGNKPAGPPPAYPGLGHNHAPAGGAPPAYSPYANRPPSYQQNGGYPNNHYNQAGMASSNHYGLGAPNTQNTPYHQPQNPYMNQGGYGGYNSMGGGGMMNPGMMGGGMMNPGMMGGGMMGGGMMGGGMMGNGMYGQKKSSMFSLSNVLTGVALYGMYRSLSGGLGGGGGYGGYGHGYGHGGGAQEVHIYDHRDKDKVTTSNDDLKPILGVLGMPQSVTGQNITLEAKTIEEVAQNVTNSNGTVTTDDTELPPLPFDSMPKIYFGYGYAYGYENATVDTIDANGNVSTAPVTNLKAPIAVKQAPENETATESSESLEDTTTTVEPPDNDGTEIITTAAE